VLQLSLCLSSVLGLGLVLGFISYDLASKTGFIALM